MGSSYRANQPHQMESGPVCVCVGGVWGRGCLTCSDENSCPWNFDSTVYGFSSSSYQATGHKKSRAFARPFAPTVTIDTVTIVTIVDVITAP